MHTTNQKSVCSPAEVTTHRKISLDKTPHNPETPRAFYDLCEEYKDTFLLHQGDIGHTKLVTIDIDKGDHLSIMHNPYTLILKHTQ